MATQIQIEKYNDIGKSYKNFTNMELVRDLFIRMKEIKNLLRT